MNPKKIKLLRQYVDLGISDAKTILDKKKGNVLEAIKETISDEKLSELKNYAIARQIVPNTLDGEPTAEELAIIEFLRSNEPIH